MTKFCYDAGNSSHIHFLNRTEKMEYKVLLTVFAAVFVAELGDKTQLATMLFASDKEVSKLTVFVGASLALIVASGVGVLAGSFISQYIKITSFDLITFREILKRREHLQIPRNM